jgi:hypothetical protein
MTCVREYRTPLLPVDPAGWHPFHNCYSVAFDLFSECPALDIIRCVRLDASDCRPQDSSVEFHQSNLGKRQMKPSKMPRERRTRLIIALLIVAILAAPALVYVWVFGTELSHDHQRWSEMGSAMSGIYTPILALLTLAVLLAQVRLQTDMNRHTFDQTFVQKAGENITFALEQLARELSREFDDGSELRKILIGAFANETVVGLAEPAVLEVAKSLNERHDRLVALWCEFYRDIAALRANKYHPYDTTYGSMKQRAISLLSYRGCAALDNLVWCVSEGKLNFDYEFSGAGIPARSPAEGQPCNTR